jgi:pimeloyl-ACP methyl ester carboxylesterase
MLARPPRARHRSHFLRRRLLPWLAAAAACVATATACETTAARCGYLTRPLDPAGSVAGTLGIYYEFYPHSGAGAAAGTLVAAEGGPGYPTTGSREDYLALFKPLRQTHDVLLMDNRGTGRSGAIDCEPLQRAPALTREDIGACGRSLGTSAPFYSTILAADDLTAVLDALKVARIDLYGDSYGTYFAQVFALRHADRLRSLVLDGAYALEGPDYAWYPHYPAAMRVKFDRACERSPNCRALPGSSIEHILPALEILRAQPIDAMVSDDAGRPLPLRADPSALAIVMFGGSPAYATVRETDAAARAFSAGDRAPLLRLMRESQMSVDSREASRSPAAYSAGLAAAVFCQDPPQVLDLALDPAQRPAALEREFVRLQHSLPDLYAPFTLDEYRGMPPDYVFIDECLDWPSPVAGGPAPPLVVPRAPYADVPVLVISGELDNMTSIADGEAAASHYPHAHHVVIANSFHVNALPRARSDCGAQLVRYFIAHLAIANEECAARVPPVPLLARFARMSQELDPAQALPGNQADDRMLRETTAALQTGADALVRAQQNGPGKFVGLRGGSFSVEARGIGYRLTLREVRWSEDVTVSGHVDFRGKRETVRAALRLQDATGRHGTLSLRWQADDAQTIASLRGRIDGRIVRAAAPLY